MKKDGEPSDPPSSPLPQIGGEVYLPSAAPGATRGQGEGKHAKVKGTIESDFVRGKPW